MESHKVRFVLEQNTAEQKQLTWESTKSMQELATVACAVSRHLIHFYVCSVALLHNGLGSTPIGCVQKWFSCPAVLLKFHRIRNVCEGNLGKWLVNLSGRNGLKPKASGFQKRGSFLLRHGVSSLGPNALKLSDSDLLLMHMDAPFVRDSLPRKEVDKACWLTRTGRHTVESVTCTVWRNHVKHCATFVPSSCF